MVHVFVDEVDASDEAYWLVAPGAINAWSARGGLAEVNKNTMEAAQQKRRKRSVPQDFSSPFRKGPRLS